MDEPGEQNEMRKETAKGVLLLVAVVGTLSVGTLGPEAFTLENLLVAIATLETASRSVSIVPLLALGSLIASVAVALRTEFGPFGQIEPNQGWRDTTAVPCRVCDGKIDPSRGKCPYCHTSDPTAE